MNFHAVFFMPFLELFTKIVRVYPMKQHLLWVTKVCYRTKIVMVYLLVLKRCINFKYSIRTRIVMVYLVVDISIGQK